MTCVFTRGKILYVFIREVYRHLFVSVEAYGWLSEKSNMVNSIFPTVSYIFGLAAARLEYFALYHNDL